MPKIYNTFRFIPGGHKAFVATNEFRPPLAGEVYLSGAIPEPWYAAHDLKTSYRILRPATEAEMFCPCCNRARIDRPKTTRIASWT